MVESKSQSPGHSDQLPEESVSGQLGTPDIPAAEVTTPSFGVVVLNWNNARETMSCVEALDAADLPPNHVVVVDNGSTDDSVERLEAWADEHWMWRMRAGTASENVESAGTPWLIIARAGANRGFAGGNNVGIRYDFRGS